MDASDIAVLLLFVTANRNTSETQQLASTNTEKTNLNLELFSVLNVGRREGGGTL